LSFDDSVRSLDDQMHALATEMASHLERTLFETLDRVTKEVGNQFDAKGRPFTAELLLDSLAMVDIEFDFFGVPQLPTLVGPATATAEGRAQLSRLTTDATLRARLQSLLLKKKEEWRDRESRRRLVD
jgi:hypothetical protein